jgi:predicted amidohydrolase
MAVRIALIQQHATRDKARNVARGLANLETAAACGAQIACFAELAFEWFHPQRPAANDRASLAEPIPGPTTDSFREKEP